MLQGIWISAIKAHHYAYPIILNFNYGWQVNHGVLPNNCTVQGRRRVFKDWCSDVLIFCWQLEVQVEAPILGGESTSVEHSLERNLEIDWLGAAPVKDHGH